MSALNHSQSEILIALLGSFGLCTDPSDGYDWAGYVSFMPDEPTNAIAAYNTTPVRQGRLHPTGETLLQYAAQLRVRGENEGIARQRANLIFNTFDTSVRQCYVPIDGDVYRITSVNNQSGPFDLGPEIPTSRRHVFTLNVLFPIALTSALDEGTGS